MELSHITKFLESQKNGTYLTWRTKANIPEATAVDADDADAVSEHWPFNPGAGYKTIKDNLAVLLTPRDGRVGNTEGR